MKHLGPKFFYYHSERCRRISVDIDGKHLKEEPLKLLRVYFTLRNMFPFAEVYVEKTFHGYHIKAIDKSLKNVPIQKKVDFREALGDDPDRIEHDKISIKTGIPYFADTLFTVKFHRSGERYVVERNYFPLLIPCASRFPAKKPR
jgi:hypothetical protein